MNNPGNPHAPKPSVLRQSTFKQVDMGNRVVLDDDYLTQNNRMLHLENLTERTIAQAEAQARDILAAAQEQANAMLQSAQDEAARIIAEEGEQQRDAVLQQAYEEGFNAGLEQGVQQMAEQLADRIQAAEAILERAFETEQRILSQQPERLVAMMTYLLKLILRYEIQTRPEQILGLMESALQRIPLTGQATFLMHPEMYGLVQSLREGEQPEQQRLVFHPNTNCAMNEVYLESIDRSFDISPEKQAEIYVQTLSPQLRDRVAEAMETVLQQDQPELLTDVCAE